MAKKLPNKIKKNPRFLAMQALVKINEGGAYSNLLLNDVLKSSNIKEIDKGLFTEMVYGVVQRKLTLEYFLQSFIQNGKKIDDWVRELLKLSLYQMEYLDRVPPHAIFNDAVEIAKTYGNIGIGKFVNGVLRNVQRRGLPDTRLIKDKVERLSIEASMPVWMILKLEKQYGFDLTEKIAHSLLLPPKVSARYNAFNVSSDEILLDLKNAGVTVELSEISPFGIVGKKGHLASVELFKKGILTMQDESSMLVADTMRLEKQHKVLDACAAPGGKTTHIAYYLDEKQGGEVTSLDIYDHKIKLIEENAERQGLSKRVKTKKADAREAKNIFSKESFDRILVDAPCSGLGLMRRKPDIKYRKQTEDFQNLQAIQLEILESVATCLKKNGIITYSTCTITEEENEQVIEKFLCQHPEFEKIPVLANEKVGEQIKNDMLTLLPNQFMTDGFFISCLQKNKEL